MHHCTLLFELSKPVIIPADKFNKVWPYVNSVYGILRGEEIQYNGTVKVQKYECRLRKSAKTADIYIYIVVKTYARYGYSVD